jgi:hypothetical protein
MAGAGECGVTDRISQPGVYQITMETYHSDCCVGPSVSSGGLNLINSECPAIFWGRSYLNPNGESDIDTKALAVGKAAHALALGEPEFAAMFAILPFDSLRTNEAKAWKAATEEAGKTIIRADDFTMVKAMAEAIKRSPQCSRAFRDGKPEQSLIWQDQETGVWLKSRPDWLPDDPANGWVIDYKTTADLRPRKFSAQAFECGYHLQAALQVDACREVLGVDPVGIGHVVQEKTAPYLAELRLFTPEQIDFGRREYRRALRIFARCWASKTWPGYTTEPQYFETPYYIAQKMEDPYHEDANGAGIDHDLDAA